MRANSTFYSQMSNWAVGNSQTLTETAKTIGGVQTLTGGISSGSNSAVGQGTITPAFLNASATTGASPELNAPVKCPESA